MPALFFLVACREPGEGPPPPGDDVPEDSTPPDSAPPAVDTAGTPAGTGDTGAPTSTWTGPLYPPAPYDCAAGVAPGPFEATRIVDVRTTEDFGFDLDGYLVASDWSTNLLRWEPDATRQVWVPSAAETRGIDVLPDGDVVVTDANVGLIVRVSRSSGAMTVLGSLGSSPSGIDVGADGTVYAGDLAAGHTWALDPAGNTVDLGEPLPGEFVQTYGAALSPDEQTLYVTQYNGATVFRCTRGATGWSAGESWVELPGAGLAGAATDVCGNVYVVASFGCEVYRIDPGTGVHELVANVQARGDYCPSLAFGRGLGGWDAYTLYVSTYHEVAAVPVGVPGRPR